MMFNIKFLEKLENRQEWDNKKNNRNREKQSRIR